ncbi:Thiamine-phosphate synthase [compost metagenome]
MIRSRTDKPLIAIGNVRLDNASAIVKAGADSLAVVSAICGADHPEQAAYAIKNELLK